MGREVSMGDESVDELRRLLASLERADRLDPDGSKGVDVLIDESVPILADALRDVLDRLEWAESSIRELLALNRELRRRLESLGQAMPQASR
jgi:hypothetical protein